MQSSNDCGAIGPFSEVLEVVGNDYEGEVVVVGPGPGLEG